MSAKWTPKTKNYLMYHSMGGASGLLGGLQDLLGGMLGDAGGGKGGTANSMETWLNANVVGNPAYDQPVADLMQLRVALVSLPWANEQLLKKRASKPAAGGKETKRSTANPTEEETPSEQETAPEQSQDQATAEFLKLLGGGRESGRKQDRLLADMLFGPKSAGFLSRLSGEAMVGLLGSETRGGGKAAEKDPARDTLLELLGKTSLSAAPKTKLSGREKLSGLEKMLERVVTNMRVSTAGLGETAGKIVEENAKLWEQARKNIDGENRDGKTHVWKRSERTGRWAKSVVELYT